VDCDHDPDGLSLGSVSERVAGQHLAPQTDYDVDTLPTGHCDMSVDQQQLGPFVVASYRVH